MKFITDKHFKKYKEEYYRINKDKCNERSKIWYVENIDFKKEYDKIYSEINKDRRSETHRNWRSNNIDNIRNYKRDYYHNVVKKDPNKLIRVSVRSMIKRFLKNKCSKTDEIIGCSYEYLREYIESKFESWMNWDNYGKYNGELNYGWDIDHIIPLSSACTDYDVEKLNHYTNLQPLCSKINRDIKRNKLNFEI